MPSLFYENQKKHHRAWRIRHKDEIDEKNKEKIMCDICNKEITRYSMRAHIKTKKHIFKSSLLTEI